MAESILHPLRQSSVPLVWVVSPEEDRLILDEYRRLNKSASSGIFTFDATNTLRCIAFPGRIGKCPGGISQALEWFSKPAPYQTTTKTVDGQEVSKREPVIEFHKACMEKAKIEFDLSGAESCEKAPDWSILFILDHGKYLVNDSKEYTDAAIARRLKRSVSDLIIQHKMIVIVSHKNSIPLELESTMVVVDHPRITEKDREDRIRAAHISYYNKRPIKDGILQEMVRNTAGMQELELANALAMSSLKSQQKCKDVLGAEPDFDLESIRAERVLSLRRSASLEVIEPVGDLSYVGGLEKVKKWARESKLIMFSEAARADGIDAPKGIMLFGLGGVGKTLVAGCIGAEWNITVLQGDISACKGKYMGESEGQFKRMLKDAEAQAPCVLVLDEFGKMFGNINSKGETTNGGNDAVQGMYATLLMWQQTKKAPVFLIMLGNDDVKNIPEPALRKERIDEIFYIGLPDAEARKEVFRIHLRMKGWDPDAEDLDLDIEVLSRGTEGFSPAEIKHVINQGVMLKFLTEGPRPIPLRTEHILKCIARTTPMTLSSPQAVRDIEDWAVEKKFLAPSEKFFNKNRLTTENQLTDPESKESALTD